MSDITVVYHHSVGIWSHARLEATPHSFSMYCIRCQPKTFQNNIYSSSMRTYTHLTGMDHMRCWQMLVSGSQFPVFWFLQGGNTALHTAARHDHHEIVGILVNSGIDLSVRNEVSLQLRAWLRASVRQDPTLPPPPQKKRIYIYIYISMSVFTLHIHVPEYSVQYTPWHCVQYNVYIVLYIPFSND